NPLFQQGIDGTGQNLAIIGVSAIDIEDMRAFRRFFNLPANDPQLVLVGTNPGVTSAVIEADLDLEWSGAVARNATISYVYGRNLFANLEYAIDQNLATVA